MRREDVVHYCLMCVRVLLMSVLIQGKQTVFVTRLIARKNVAPAIMEITASQKCFRSHRAFKPYEMRAYAFNQANMLAEYNV